jgi:hypothetical protein
MTPTLAHPLSRALHEAALGRFPSSADTAVEVGQAWATGPCDAVSFFTHRVVVTADLDADWVQDTYDRSVRQGRHDVSGGHGRFLAAITRELGMPPTLANLLSVTRHRPAFHPGSIEAGGEVDAEWMAYHHDVRIFRYRSEVVDGTIALGRGPGDRWDVQPSITRHDATRGNGARELLTAAKTLVPERAPLFGMSPLHRMEILRRGLRAEFTPVCTEVLLLTRPQLASRGRAEVPSSRTDPDDKWSRQ